MRRTFFSSIYQSENKLCPHWSFVNASPCFTQPCGQHWPYMHAIILRKSIVLLTFLVICITGKRYFRCFWVLYKWYTVNDHYYSHFKTTFIPVIVLLWKIFHPGLENNHICQILPDSITWYLYYNILGQGKFFK